jgi:hypothetical protein
VNGFVNAFEFSEADNAILAGDWDMPISDFSVEHLNDQGHYVGKVNNLIPWHIREVFYRNLKNMVWKVVGLDGIADKAFDQVGNYRLSNYNEGFADALWRCLQPSMDTIRECNPFTPTDHDNHPLWKPIGVNPLMRFIRYDHGGQLVGHYDAAYIKDDKQRSLMSMVIYITNNPQGGATRFLRDPQVGKRMDEMDFSDWDRSGNDDEVILANYPKAGSALIFDHRLLHDGEPIGPRQPGKLIIRTDIMFERV